MKAGKFVSAIVIFSAVLLGSSAPTGDTDAAQFEHCQRTYNQVIEHITGSEGEEVTATIWRLIFHYLDLDGNNQLTAPEIALYLEKEQYVHTTDVMEIIHEATKWMKIGDGGDEQLTIQEFVNVVEKTIGENSESTEYSEISATMCHLFTAKVPHIAESMTELESCTKNLEESILSDKSERAEFNSWLAIFQTMDANQDRKIEFEELKKNIGHALTTDDDLSIASALGQAIYGSVHHDVQNIEEKNFYVFVHELLYGLNTENRKHSWGDVVDEHELRGRAMLCKAIYDVRKQLSGQRNVMDDCIKSYETTKRTILGEDGVFAPEIVFTMADADRDGKISQKEFDAFLGAPSTTLYGTIERKHAAKTMKIDQFRSVMPDEMIEAKKDNDVEAKFELSSMTSSELHDAEKLCSAIIASVQKYPHEESGHGEETKGHAFIPPAESFKGMGHYNFHEYTLPSGEEEEPTTPAPESEVLHLTDHNGNPLEITIKHPGANGGNAEENPSPPQSESFKGMGNYEWSEHTIPHVQDNHLTPPAPSRPAPPGELEEGVVYHMTDADGNPIQLHFGQIEIDDILHRMALAQHTPVEPQPDSHPQPSHDDGGDSDIMREIEKIIKARTEEEKKSQQAPSENDDEKDLKNLLENLEKSAQGGN